MSGRNRRDAPRRALRRTGLVRAFQGRGLKTPILIVCEGERTERYYLDQLKREDAVTRQFAITIKSAKGRSRRQIVQVAIDRKNNSSQDYDAVWCVMDVEGSTGEEHQKDLREARDMARTNGITVYLSKGLFQK